VNAQAVTCSDGRTRERCYVAEIDFWAVGLDRHEERRFADAIVEGRAVVRGLVISDPPERKLRGYGLLLADEGWLAVGQHAGDAVYRARRAPGGASYEVLELGSEQAAYIDALDLAAIRGEHGDLATAMVQLERRELLVVGTIVRGRSGFRLAASQVYLQLGRMAPRPVPSAPPRTAQID
jgi:hypothetical protein